MAEFWLCGRCGLVWTKSLARTDTSDAAQAGASWVGVYMLPRIGFGKARGAQPPALRERAAMARSKASLNAVSIVLSVVSSITAS